MNVLSTFLLTYVLLGAVLAQDGEEALNQREVSALSGQLWGEGEHFDGGSSDESNIYAAIDWAVRPDNPLFDTTTADFTMVGGEVERTGMATMSNHDAVGDLEVSLGLRQALGGRLNIRYQASLKWIQFDFGDLAYDNFDFAPIPLDEANRLASVDGLFNMTNPHGGAFLDVELGNSGNFVYVGSSVGLVKAEAQYQLEIGSFTASMDDADWAKMVSWEAGAIFKLGKRTGLRLTFNTTRVGNFDLTTKSGSSLNFRPHHIHSVRVGFIHFFRRRR